MLATLLIIGAVLAVVLSRPVERLLAARPTAQQCRELLALYLAHVRRAQVPAATSATIAAAGKRVAQRPDRFRQELSSCQQQLTEEQVLCGLRSTNVDGFERCMQ